MKNLFTPILLAFCITISAQDLFVSTGSYVFVDGTAFSSGSTVAPLFVTNDIELDNNGHIYLRNDAQLIQNNNVGNDGNGQLSVYQTGTSNTYMYNYWSSPVGLNSGVAGNTTFRPSNNIYGETAAPITSLAATYVSEPNYAGVAGSAGTPPVIASFWFYSFTGSSAAPNEYLDWVALDENTATLGAGYGWTMKGNPSGAQQYDFRGRPNNGTINNITVNPNLETLVGNPYPSAIDARAFIHDATNSAIIDAATLSFWEQDPVNSTSHVLVNYQGGYATYTINATGPVVETFTPATFDTYNADGTLNTTGVASATGKRVHRYIPIGQGFMVAGNASGGNLRFTNSMRVFQKQAATLSDFFKPTANTTGKSNAENDNSVEASYNEYGLSIMPEDYKRFRINLDFNETYTRQLTQTFHHSATNGKDYGLETLSPEAIEADAYWPQDEDAYNAQAFNFDVNLRIPLVVNIGEAQSFRFRIFDVQNFDESQAIFVYDNENESYFNLRNQDYELNIEAGNYTDRFEIVFTTQSALNVDEFDANAVTIRQNNNTSQLTVFNPKGIDVKTIEVFDVAGKRILNSSYDVVSEQYSLPTSRFSDGVYVVNVQSRSSTKAVSQKIIVKN